MFREDPDCYTTLQIWIINFCLFYRWWTSQSLKNDPTTNLRWWYCSGAEWIWCKWPGWCFVLSESDKEFIPQENIEGKCDESDTGSENSDGDYVEYEFIAKSQRKLTSTVTKVTRRWQSKIARGSPRQTSTIIAADIMSEVFKILFDEQTVDNICIFTNAEASLIVQYFNINAPLSRMRIWIDDARLETRIFLVSCWLLELFNAEMKRFLKCGH